MSRVLSGSLISGPAAAIAVVHDRRAANETNILGDQLGTL